MSQQEPPSSVTVTNFDLLSYSKNYEGNSLYSRLLHIASSSSSSSSLSLEAYKLLSSYLQEGCNTKLYCEVFSDKSLNLPSPSSFDKSWVDETERQNEVRLTRLEADYSTACSSMIKEAIRVALSDLGEHHNEVGNLSKAHRNFLMTREYNSMPRHSEEMVLSLCSCAVDMKRLDLLPAYLNQEMEENASSPLVKNKLRVFSALYSLNMNDYASTARKFASVESNIIGNFRRVMSAQDISLMAVLCSIAVLERIEIKALLVENPRFKAVLETEPMSRQLLDFFLSGNYGSFKSSLEGEVRQRVEMDIHLNSHASRLYSIIHDKIVLQYFKPFSSIQMSQAVKDLYTEPKTSEEAKEQENELKRHILQMISEQKMEARIDAGCPQGSTIRKVVLDKRALALQSVWNLAQTSSSKMQQSVLRLSLLKHNFVVSPESWSQYDDGFDVPTEFTRDDLDMNM